MTLYLFYVLEQIRIIVCFFFFLKYSRLQFPLHNDEGRSSAIHDDTFFVLFIVFVIWYCAVIIAGSFNVVSTSNFSQPERACKVEAVMRTNRTKDLMGEARTSNVHVEKKAYEVKNKQLLPTVTDVEFQCFVTWQL